MVVIPESIRRCIDAAIGGDATAMGTAFQWFRPRLYAHALRICGNTPVAQDAVQDTFIGAFTHLDSLREPASFYPWLKRILVNNCYQLLRKERSDDLEHAMAKGELLIHRSLDHHYESIADRQWLFDAIRYLSAELRACVMFRYFSEFRRYDQIALLLGVPVGTVRSRLAAARQQLMERFLLRQDADDSALHEAGQWSNFYRHQWENMYDNAETRNQLFNHLHPKLQLRFTSGKSATGRALLENEISDDLEFGSRFQVSNVISSGNISVVEGPNINHPDQPYRCAPMSAFVLFREEDKAVRMHVFDSPRS